MHLAHPLIDSLLKAFREALGRDMDRYRNHVYRVFNLCCMLDGDLDNREKYAYAAVFHDLGIWTAGTFDYLDPSEGLLREHLSNTLDEEELEELRLMIHFHHKMSPYKGKFAQTVETFRRADWVDVTLGLKKLGSKGAERRALRKAFPNEGFHRMLLKKGFLYFLRHPLRPLPMFKK